MFQDEADQAANAPTVSSRGPEFSPGHQTRRGRTFRAPVLIGAIVAGGMLGGAAAAGAGSLLEPPTGAPASVSSPVTAQVVVNSTDGAASVTAAAKKASPSVVTISATSGSAGGTGSGIILDAQGHILTNTHVVTLDGQSASASIEVRTNDGNVYPGTVVGTDPLSDLAVVKIDSQGLVPAALGDSSKANVGDKVIAIGAPLGLQGTVTDGIVSALNRTISIASSAAPDTSGSSGSNGSGGNGRRYRYSQPGAQNSTGTSSSDISINVLQTDAPINPGNSGGPLVNSAGEVLGINVAIASAGASTSGGQSGSIGVGFSIPVNDAKRVAQEIIAGGSASHGQLGASLADAQAGSGSQFTSGAQVTAVSGGTPAANAGITSGDVITALDGRAIQNAEEATASIREHAAGDTVSVTLMRGGTSQHVDVTLGATPKA